MPTKLNISRKHIGGTCKGFGTESKANKFEATQFILEIERKGYLTLGPIKYEGKLNVFFYDKNCIYCGSEAGRRVTELLNLKRR